MKCNVLIDWLTFTTTRYETPKELIKDCLKLDFDLFDYWEYSPLPGYASSVRFNSIIVCFEPREDEHFQNMGMCVSLSGMGCREYENLGGSLDELIKLVARNEEEFNCTRIDIACDDKEDLLPLDEIFKKVDSNEINSLIRRRTLITEYDGKHRRGKTAYIGSKASSEFFCRIYDKAKQLYKPGEKGFDECWKRVELVFRKDQANAVVKEFLDEFFILGQFAAEIMNGKFKFIEMDDSNISRCSTCDWWVNFLETIEKLKIAVAPEVTHTVSEIYDWLTTQVARNLTIIHNTLGFDFIQRLYLDDKKLKKKHNAIIDNWKALEKGSVCCAV